MAVPVSPATTTGLYGDEINSGYHFRWTEGDAKFVLSPGISRLAKTLTIDTADVGPPFPMTVLINGVSVYSGPKSLGSRDFTVPAGDQMLTLEITSQTLQSPGDPRRRGLALRSVRLSSQ